MLDAGYRSARNAKSGVDVGPLAKTMKVSREMARRYLQGEALPDPNRMQLAAQWLGVRVPWLRDGEGDKRSDAGAAEPAAVYNALNADAIEVARAWSKLSRETQEITRDVIFMLALGEKRFPWLRRGRPTSETYQQWEKRQEDNFAALSAFAAQKKAARSR